MAARRGRRKYTWFPVIGTGDGDIGIDNINGRVFQVDMGVDKTTTVLIAPLIPDVPMEGDSINPDAPGQLVQAIGQEYLLERIVGKILIGVRGGREADLFPTTISTVLVGAGIFVARANDADVGGGVNTPIGSATAAERQENYSPLAEECIREPWIWRRIWLLGNPATDMRGGYSPSTGLIAQEKHTVFPPTTAHYGSVMDGPHIDAKSNRRIGNDDRLWLAIAATNWESADGSTVYPDASSGSQLFLAGYIDYRILGRLVRARGKSSF